MDGSRSHTPDPLSPEAGGGSPAQGPQRGQGQVGASPTMQQRIKAIGVPTPLAISSPIRRYIISAPKDIYYYYYSQKHGVYSLIIYYFSRPTRWLNCGEITFALTLHFSFSLSFGHHKSMNAQGNFFHQNYFCVYTSVLGSTKYRV